MKLLYAVIILFLLASCSNNGGEGDNQTLTTAASIDTNTAGATDTATGSGPDTVKTCYHFDNGEEHNWMKMTRIGDTAYGELHYTWEGKDGANGTFHGNFSGDTLWILFNSYGEGHYVDLERAYLLSGEKLLEGQGMQDSNEAGNYYYFKHKKLIEFSDKEFLAKGPCM